MFQRNALSRLTITLTVLFAMLTAPLAQAASTAVREPRWGTPHVYADTDLEMAYQVGRQVALDRLVQLILFARAGRGTLSQAFGLLDPSFIDDDVDARREGYTSSELNQMYANMPQADADMLLEYCKGVNDVIEEIYAGSLPEPLEINVLRTLGLGADLFGNATNLSDQVDPFYLPPGGADPGRPLAGFQYTPEMGIAIGVIQIRRFGAESFGEDSRFGELQALIGVHGTTAGTEIWRDLNFLNDPLAPVTVPDATTPGFGGPLAAVDQVEEDAIVDASDAGVGAPTDKAEQAEKAVETGATDAEPTLAEYAARFPAHDYLAAADARRERFEDREARGKKWGAWMKLGSYTWMIAANRSATGNPWIGGFPQMGIQTPSIMQFTENRSGETVHAMGMQLVGAPLMLIGHNDTVAYSSTTAQLRVADTFFEEVVLEDSDVLRYNDEGTPSPMLPRTETIFANSLGVTETFTFWRTHERGGNGGDRPVSQFLADAAGTATGGSVSDLTDTGASFGAPYVGGYVAIIDGTGVGQIREISAATTDTLTAGAPFTTAPDDTSEYVAVVVGGDIVAISRDLAYWMEESTSVWGWAQMQKADSCLDVRAAARVMPSTHNFPCVDNLAFNGVGTDGGKGNIAYFSGGFSRKRQDATDKLLPMDGTSANPLAVVEGAVDSAGASALVATGAFSGQDFSPPAVNFRYQNPTLQGSEYLVTITSGTGYRQTRRIASNDDDSLTVEYPWSIVPAGGDTFEITEIVAMPEAINPAEGYMANWNNKAATADDGSGFGRNHRVAFITERLADDPSWDRDKQRQLNKDVAGLSGNGNMSRYLVPRLRQAIEAVGNGGNPDVDTVLAQLEAHNATPEFGRGLVDPVTATEVAGEVAFINSLTAQLADDIYGDEFTGAVGVPGGSRGLAMVMHAIDSAAGDVTGSYAQQFAGDYFNGSAWETVVRDSLSALASGGIPADSPRGNDIYAHPLAGLFSELIFPPTPAGNRGTWEEIIEVGDTIVGEFMFPLGQSGLIEGSLGGGVTSIDPNNTSLSPLWRDWRFLPMLTAGSDLEAGGSVDSDADGVWDSYERWYFGDLSRAAKDDSDKDKLSLVEEFLAGSDPTDPDTDDDQVADGTDRQPQDRLLFGFAKLSAKLKRSTKADSDTLKVSGKGKITGTFDPATDDVVLTVSDANGDIYAVTVPAGTMTAKNATTFLYKDKTGSISALQQIQVKLGKTPDKDSKLKVKTIKTDFSAVDVATMREVTTLLTNGATETFNDTRDWEPKGTTTLQSTK
ncbi:MAG: hypothetical protein E4H03_06765 [Myxococcales bacterium]|nr:MAG: hypothetical protein E4H03_06765 [Myxococcales bacterium]